MKANDCALIIVTILYAIVLIISYYKEKEYKEQIQKQEAIIGILSDCVHNMIDNYGDEDSIYDNYINIAYEETGVKEQEFINYSYCY